MAAEEAKIEVGRVIQLAVEALARHPIAYPLLALVLVGLPIVAYEYLLAAAFDTDASISVVTADLSLSILLFSLTSTRGRLHLAIQTNGTRLRPEWTDVLKKYDVYVGVSIDGPAEVHDPSRPFHNGKGSLAKIASGLSEIHQADPLFFKSRVGSLTVLNAANDYRSIIDYFSDDLGLASQGFLLPDCTHDDGIPDGWTAADYGRTLCAIFDRWVQQPDLKIREIDKLLRCFQRAKLAPGTNIENIEERSAARRRIPNHIIVLQSDGTLKLDDSYIPASEWREGAPVVSIFDVELGDYLENPVFSEIFAMQETPPSQCESCRWVRICRGGDIENRWSSERKFDNPSVFCEGLKSFYSHVTGYLIANGYPEEYVEQRLSGQYDFVTDGYAA